MRSRAAILPYPGDPFLLNYWLKFFDTVWGDEVDRLYIGLNSPIESEMVDYIRKLCASRPKVYLSYTDSQKDHGPTINTLLDLVTEKYVVLLEDDGFIFKKGMVDWCFTQLESGNAQVVGSKRGSCATEILEAAKAKWGLNYDGEGDQGPNFWPCYLFCETELLISTDRNFSAKAWYKGDYIKEIDYKVGPDVIYGDTFVNTSLQLRAMVPADKIVIVPQYHGHPDDIAHSLQQRYLFDGRAAWTHVGSLSSGVGGILQDEYGRCLARRTIDPPKENAMLPNWCHTDDDKKEWERRVQWWTTFRDEAANTLTTAEELAFWHAYSGAISRIVEQYHLSPKAIRNRQVIYKELGL